MTDMSIDIPGVRGLNRSTWSGKKTHLRSMLLKLVAQNPDASREELEELYLDKARRKPAFVEEALLRAFNNDFARVKNPVQKPRFVSKAAVITAAENIKNVILLDLMMPNGKKLRDCTGSECAMAGGWLLKVAKRVGVNGIVGDKLSEKQLVKIFATND